MSVSGLRLLLVLALSVGTSVACTSNSPPAATPPAPTENASGDVAVRPATVVPSTAQEAPYWRAQLDPSAARWVDETLASLSLEELIGQIVIPWIPGGYQADDSDEFLELIDWVERLVDPAGGAGIQLKSPVGCGGGRYRYVA